MRLTKRKRWYIAGTVAVVALLTLGFLWFRAPLVSSASVGKTGGDAWASGHTVGVRVAAGGVDNATILTFTPGAAQQKAPADSLMDVIGDPVDITPDHAIATGKAQVMFTMPASVPSNIDCAKPDPKRPRSICNAGIEVFNTNVGGWIPLETHIEHGNILVADAPHFSEYRSVWTKIGDFTVNAATSLYVHLANDTTPDAILAQTAGAYFKQFFGAITGTFDQEKLAPCEKTPSKTYVIDFQLDNPKVKPCVTENGGKTKLLLGDALAVPLVFTADTKDGVTPEVGTEAELTTALRNKIAGAREGNSVIVSGLDTGNFLIDPDKAPDLFTVKSAISWRAVGADFALATFEIFLPESKLVEATAPLIEFANCLTTGVQKIPSMAAGDIPGKLAETLKSCALGGVLQKLKANELLGALLKEAKILPEAFQVGQAASRALSGGPGLGDSAFTVSNPLKALKGAWIYQCGGSDDGIDFLFKGDDTWKVTELGPDNNIVASYQTSFTTELEEGRPVLVIDSTNLPGVKKGDKLHVTFQPGKNGFADSIIIGDNWMYFRYGGQSYC